MTKQELLERIELLMNDYATQAAENEDAGDPTNAAGYFDGVADGLNKAWKLVNKHVHVTHLTEVK